MADKKNSNNNEIYEYIKSVDEKVEQNEKIIKFIVAQQSEQMKELIASKTDGLRRFFEETVKTQTEIVRNVYEEIITELKNTYEKDLKNKELENIKQYNLKAENLRLDYEKKLEVMAEENYEKVKNSVIQEYEDRIVEINAWHEKNLQTKLSEAEDYFRKIEQQTANEAYMNGKADAEAWHDDVVRQKLEVQAQYFKEELQNQAIKLKTEYEQYFSAQTGKKWTEKDTENFEQSQIIADEACKQLKREYEERIAEINAWHEKNLADKLEESKNYYEKIIRELSDGNYTEAIERAKNEVKAEMIAQMDEAARRNEEELKLFLDFYEAKIKPFKKLINIHETTDKRIKEIQQKLQRRFNKTFGEKGEKK